MDHRVEILQIAADDGYPLAASLHLPATTSSGLVIIASATGVRRSYYSAFANYLADQGLTTLSFDYRGIGESKPPKLPGFTAHMREWGQLDLDAILAYAIQQLPQLPLYLVGHSVGGQLVGFAKHNDRITAMIGIAAQSGYYGHWSGMSRLRMLANWYLLVPTITGIFGYLPGQFGTGQHLPANVAREWASWCRSPEYLMMEDKANREASFSRMNAPTLAYSFSDDSFAPASSVKQLMGFYPSARCHFRHIDTSTTGPIGHFGFFRKSIGEPLWPDAVAWLKSHPAPSRQIS